MAVQLPPSYPITQVKLDASTQGKITNVNLYGNRADITRAFQVKMASGQNHVTVTGLPNVLDQSSIRVEGRGKATIQDVTASLEPAPTPPTTSEKLRTLQEEREDANQALERCTKTLAGLDQYLQSLDVKYIATTPQSENRTPTVLPILDNYNDAAEKYDRKARELRRALKKIEDQISDEAIALSHSVDGNTKCLFKATIGIFAETEGNVELVLKYGVRSASWNALYDIRVNTETKENPVEIVYKAAIQQNTGEDWTDVPVILETAAPTFGLALPTLQTWSLSVYKPAPPIQMQASRSNIMRFTSSKKRRSTAAAEEAESDEDMGFGLFDDGPQRASAPPPPRMAMATAAVTSQGGVNATFRVPGLISIPSDGVAHNVTIVNLTPEANLAWLAVPLVDTRVHLSTNIKNTSEYTFLSGASSVYVDGSFIAKSRVPLVSPQETFPCALGLDPSIRITYHPQSKKSSQSGLITKTSLTTFNQRISVHNSKSSAVGPLKIIDRIPVSQDALITTKLVTPALALPATGQGSASGTLKDLTSKAAGNPTVNVAEGIVAGWSGADDGDGSANEHLGKDGKVQWMCSLAPQQKLDLSLQWEVSVPSQTVVLGL